MGRCTRTTILACQCHIPHDARAFEPRRFRVDAAPLELLCVLYPVKLDLLCQITLDTTLPQQVRKATEQLRHGEVLREVQAVTKSTKEFQQRRRPLYASSSTR
jgi:hypothetical protein